MKPLTFISLYSGIGGLDAGLEAAGWRCVAQVERDEFCLAALEQHWPGLLRIHDVADAGSHNLPRANFVVGGDPCQPVSVAGRRLGADDERWLWPESMRIVRELRPDGCVFENVPGLTNLGLDERCADLEAAGYACWPFGLGLDALGAPQERVRIFIVAFSISGRLSEPWISEVGGAADSDWQTDQPLAPMQIDWPARPGDERDIPTLADGLPERLARHARTAVGNAVSPIAAEVIGRAIVAAHQEVA